MKAQAMRSKALCSLAGLVFCFAAYTSSGMAQDAAYYNRKAEECDANASQAISRGNFSAASHYSQMGTLYRNLASKNNEKMIDQMFREQSKSAEDRQFHNGGVSYLPPQQATQSYPASGEDDHGPPALLLIVVGLIFAAFMWNGISKVGPKSDE